MSSNAASLTEAVALYRGGYLTRFCLRDSYNFEKRHPFQADARRRELAVKLERVVHWHSGQRKFDPAVAYARRWLALDPLDEQVHRELMRLHAWFGGRPASGPKNCPGKGEIPEKAPFYNLFSPGIDPSLLIQHPRDTSAGHRPTSMI